MNFGIAGRWALECAASKGLARGEQAVKETAHQLRAINPEVTVIAVAGDISTPEGRGLMAVALTTVSKGAYQPIAKALHALHQNHQHHHRSNHHLIVERW
jgi:G3E family GTPase